MSKRLTITFNFNGSGANPTVLRALGLKNIANAIEAQAPKTLPAIEKHYWYTVCNPEIADTLECSVCGEEIIGDDIEERHTHEGDCHERCCPVCHPHRLPYFCSNCDNGWQYVGGGDCWAYRKPCETCYRGKIRSKQDAFLEEMLFLAIKVRGFPRFMRTKRVR